MRMEGRSGRRKNLRPESSMCISSFLGSVFIVTASGQWQSKTAYPWKREGVG